jgi:hypothetical protein
MYMPGRPMPYGDSVIRGQTRAGDILRAGVDVAADVVGVVHGHLGGGTDGLPGDAVAEAGAKRSIWAMIAPGGVTGKAVWHMSIRGHRVNFAGRSSRIGQVLLKYQHERPLRIQPAWMWRSF